MAILTFSFLQETIAQRDPVCNVRGTVTDAKGNAIPFAHVLIESLSVGTTTDVEGNYLLKNIPKGNFILVVKVIGYNKKEQVLEVNGDPDKTIDFVLEEDTRQLDEIFVVGETKETQLERSAQAINLIDMQEIKLQSADLGEVLAQVQGVSIQRAGGLGSDTRFSLNGLSGDQIRFFFNGIPLDFSSYATGIANVPVNLIERVEIYKGVVPIALGADALGGAVNLVSPSLEEGFHGGISYQTGSFGTHRVSLDLRNYSKESGFFLGAGGFFDYARNNYKVDVEVPDERGRLNEVTVPRFNDRYRAAGINLSFGIKNKPWANELSVQAFYGDAYNEIQHNALMSGIPYGEVHTKSNSYGLNLNYSNTIGSKTLLNAVMGYNQLERQFIDTSFYAYNWFGERILRKRIPGEISGQTGASHQFTWDDNIFSRINLVWQLAEGHDLSVSLAPTYTLREGDELFSGTTDPLARQGELFTWVNGVEYKLSTLDGKLQNIVFAKNYWQNLSVEQDASSEGSTITNQRNVHRFGVGNGIRYKFSDRWMAKFTYENATRLPRPDEVFGDGQLVLKSLELRPEQSHNFNLETTLQNDPQGLKEWNVTANLFVRDISDLIILIAAMDRSNIHSNVFNAVSQGLELSGQWRQAGEGFGFSANTTYQRYYNNSNEGDFVDFEGDRIPNLPYFFANVSVNYTLIDNWKAQDRLSFFWTGRYVHEFFRGWESAGTTEFKQEVPRQQLHHAGFTYNLPVGQTSMALTGEVQNIFDARVFDFFGIQRPGRAFYVKLTTQF